MPVVVKRIIDGTQVDLEARKYNIYVAISLGSDYLNRARLQEYLLWALQYTKKDVLVLIADKIQEYNYQVLKGYDLAKARETAERVGQDRKNEADRVVRSLPQKLQSKIHVIRWADVESDHHFQQMKTEIYNEWRANDEFKSAILEVVTLFMGSRNVSDSAKETLAHYVLDELPTMIGGVWYKNIQYNLYPYPGVSKVVELVSDIQNGKLFSELAQRLSLEGRKVVVVEAYAE